MSIIMFITVLSMIAPLIFLIANWLITHRTISVLISFMLIFILMYYLNYCLIPEQTLANILFNNGMSTLFTAGIYYVCANVSTYYHSNKQKRSEADDISFNVLNITTSSILAGVIIIGICATWIATNSHSKLAHDSITATVETNKTAPTLKRGETPVAITPKAVFNKVSKAMSDVPNSNYYEIAGNEDGDNEIQAQYWQGKPVYIVPLQYRGYFQYRNAKMIPGYFRISATEPNAEPVFVKKDINYSDSSYLERNIDRIIYNHAFTYVSLSNNAQLEIDDAGHPYYVKTLYRPRLFDTQPRFNQLKVAVADAETGKFTLYDPKDAPKFIDESLTSDVADSINNYYGRYNLGWLNTHFGQKGMKIPTENGPEDGVTTVFDNHGNINYLSDFTSTSSSTNSALGYSMINARTGQLTYYNTSGIMDTDGAIDNADRNYHAQNYHAEMPVLYNIDGHATWVMSILDNSGLQRGFYYVDGANPSIHADGNDVTTTMDAFRNAIVSGGGKVTNTKGAKTKKLTGTVQRCFISSKSIAIFKLDGHKQLYTVNSEDYQIASLMRPGDTVSFTEGFNGSQNTATNFKDASIK